MHYHSFTLIETKIRAWEMKIRGEIVLVDLETRNEQKSELEIEVI